MPSLELDVSVKAVYRDGKVKLQLIGAMPISPGSERSAATTIESGFSKDVIETLEAAFKAIVEAHQEELITQTYAAASEALVVASRMKEL